MILNEDIQFTGGNRYEIEPEMPRSPSPFQIKTKPTDKKYHAKGRGVAVENNANDDLFAPKDWEEQAIPKVPEGDIHNRPEDAEAY